MKCPLCGQDEATQLLNSVLCCNSECKNYDADWALEQGYVELDDKALEDPTSFKISSDGGITFWVQTVTLNTTNNFNITWDCSTGPYYVDANKSFTITCDYPGITTYTVNWVEI